MFGERKDGTIGDLFAEVIIDRLPEIMPTASIEIVRSLLRDDGVTVRSSVANRTVDGLVTETVSIWDLKDGNIIVDLA